MFIMILSLDLLFLSQALHHPTTISILKIFAHFNDSPEVYFAKRYFLLLGRNCEKGLINSNFKLLSHFYVHYIFLILLINQRWVWMLDLLFLSQVLHCPSSKSILRIFVHSNDFQEDYFAKKDFFLCREGKMQKG